MHKRTLVGLFLGLFVSTAITPLQAARPRHWTVSTLAEFLEGEFQGVSVSSEGHLILAPELQLVFETGEALIHSAVADRSGNLFLGTGSNGKIFRITGGSSGELWADLDENGVFGLVVDSSNRVYAATAPEGKVYRFDSQGTPEVFFDPKEKYLWDLAIDRNNNLFVATGPKGIIYRIDPQGNGSTFYDAKETHLVALGWDIDGNLLAGSAPGALLYRVTGPSSAFVLYDSPMEEIKALEVDRYGNIYAAGLSYEGTEVKTPAAVPNAAVTPAPATTSRETESAESTLEIEGTRKGKKLEIYRIDRVGLVEKLYAGDAEMAFDLLVRSNGSLMVATSNKGRIISVSPRRMLRLLAQSPDEQVTQLLEVGSDLFAATSNLGKFYRLLPTPSRLGVYESDVLDAGVLSDWGRIRWTINSPAGEPARLFTRSGNTEKPDETWSAWSDPYTNPTGNAVVSPAARLLQWKIEFPGNPQASTIATEANAVSSVTVSYQQRNLAPAISKLTVHAPGLAFVKLPVTNPGGGAPPGGPDNAHIGLIPDAIRNLQPNNVIPPPRRVYIPGARSISWSGSDPNGDDLIYSVYYRGQDEGRWRLLDEDRTEAYYTLDGATLPDGAYLFKVEASDRPGNPPSKALTGELISKAFVICNTNPVVSVAEPQIEAGRATVRFTVRTAAALVHQAEYSLDAQLWQIVHPTDGIADSELEEFDLRLEGLGAGEHLVTIRVVDSVGNIGNGKTSFRIP